MKYSPKLKNLPPRYSRPSPFTFGICVAIAALLIVSIRDVSPTPTQLIEGGPRMWSLIDRMLPPNTDAASMQRHR